MSPHILGNVTDRVARLTRLASSGASLRRFVDQSTGFSRSVDRRRATVIWARRPDNQASGHRQLHGQRNARSVEASPSFRSARHRAAISRWKN